MNTLEYDILLIDKKNRFFPYRLTINYNQQSPRYIDYIDIALQHYIENTLGFEKGFKLSKEHWQTINDPLQPENIYDFVEEYKQYDNKITLINGLCTNKNNQIDKIFFGNHSSFNEYSSYSINSSNNINKVVVLEITLDT